MSSNSIGCFNYHAALASLMLLCAFAAPTTAAVSVSITVAPPALPVYVQPPCPGDGYIWTPGYWAWADRDYYWVPGTWVQAPAPGLLWTPGYWAWEGVHFVFHDGYWGPHVGFYGGINYGFGYGGTGFEGGYWKGGHFYYNRAIANISGSNVRNVYTKTVIHNTINVISYNGGRGGMAARPTAAELRVATERHVPPVAAQSEMRAMQARQHKERHELQDRQAAERSEIDRQHASEERRQTIAATHAREQQELTRRHEQEKQEFEAHHKERHPA